MKYQNLQFFQKFHERRQFYFLVFPNETQFYHNTAHQLFLERSNHQILPTNFLFLILIALFGLRGRIFGLLNRSTDWSKIMFSKSLLYVLLLSRRVYLYYKLTLVIRI